jgi:hypothetical protein
MTWFEKLIAALIVAILVAVFIGTPTSTDKFKAACADAGGTPLWDGRQYQCLKK